MLAGAVVLVSGSYLIGYRRGGHARRMKRLEEERDVAAMRDGGGAVASATGTRELGGSAPSATLAAEATGEVVAGAGEVVAGACEVVAGAGEGVAGDALAAQQQAGKPLESHESVSAEAEERADGHQSTMTREVSIELTEEPQSQLPERSHG